MKTTLKGLLSVTLAICIVLSTVFLIVPVASAGTINDDTARAKLTELQNAGIIDRGINFTGCIDVSKHQTGSDIINTSSTSDVYFVTGSAKVTGKDPARINVKNGGRVVLYFYDCTMDYSECKKNYSPVTVESKGAAYVHFLGNCKFIGSNERAGIEKNYDSGGSWLNIYLWDGCNVEAIGGSNAAGIGSSSGENNGSGYIRIDKQGDNGTGKLVATGKDNGAGIGGSKSGGAHNIEICGGVIEAAGGKYGAGIGGGNDGKKSENIRIFGGDVTATGGEEGAGIGGGFSGSVENITISGGKVNARSRAYAAGIGSGGASKQDLDNLKSGKGGIYCKGIYISGGDVYARGANIHGAAIGGGSGSKAEDISLTGGKISTYVRYVAQGTVIGRGADGTADNVFAMVNKPETYCKVSLNTDYCNEKKWVDSELYPGERLDIYKKLTELYDSDPLNVGGLFGHVFVEKANFEFINCTHTKQTTTEDGRTITEPTDKYSDINDTPVRWCSQCYSVISYDDNAPEIGEDLEDRIIGDFTFKPVDKVSDTQGFKTFELGNPNGNKYSYTVPEVPSGIKSVTLDGVELEPGKNGAYTVKADSSYPNNRHRHKIVIKDNAGFSKIYDNVTVYEAIYLTAYIDDEAILVNGSFEPYKVIKGSDCTIRQIKSPGYDGYYTVYLNDSDTPITTTCKTELSLGRLYEDTAVRMYTEKDTAPPEGSISAGNSEWSEWNNASFNADCTYIGKDNKVTINAQDSQSGVESVRYIASAEKYTIEQVQSLTDWRDYTEPFTVSAGETYYVYAEIKDKVGKVTYINSGGLRVDDEAPVITSVSGNPEQWQSNAAELTAEATDNVGVTSAQAFYENEKDPIVCTILEDGSIKFIAKQNGKYRLVVKDNAGNTAETEVVVTKIDSSTPSFTVSSDPDEIRTSAKISINDISKQLSGYKLYYSKDGAAETQLDTNELTVTENGTYTFRMVSGAGLEFSSDVTYTQIDTLSPEIDVDLNGYINDSWTNQSVTVTPKNKAQNLGTTKFMYKLDDGEWSDWTNDDIVIDKEGVTVCCIAAKSQNGIETSKDNPFEIKVKIDKTKPDGDISYNESSVKQFINKISFGLFFNKTVTANITAEDELSGVKSIEFYKSEKILDEKEINAVTDWKKGRGFSMAPVDKEKFVTYVRITDNAGNVTVFGSDGSQFDTTLPQISAIENNATYCFAQTVKVYDDNLEKVLVNNKEIQLDKNGQFRLESKSGSDKKQTVTAVDKAGNEQTVTVTINGGHTPENDDGNCETPVLCAVCKQIVTKAKVHDFSGEIKNDENGHWHVCQNDGCSVSEAKTPHSGTDDGDCTTPVICACGWEITPKQQSHDIVYTSNGDGTHTISCTRCEYSKTEDCSGGTPDCSHKAACEHCNAPYGELDPHNHTNLERQAPKENSHKGDGNIEYWYCDGCDGYFADKDGEKRITLADTVIGRKTEHTPQSPKWDVDEMYHFHKCECGEIIDKTKHSFKWVTDKAATDTQTGIKHEQCSVCGYKTHENTVIPAKGVKSPKTVDSSNILLLTALAFLSFTALAGTILYRKSTKGKRKDS